MDNTLIIATDEMVDSMIRKGIWFLLFLTVGISAGPGFALEIQNFRSGLVCELELELSDVDMPIEWICFETETVYITGQGRCVYDRKDEHCTWYGYEFDYTGAVEGEEIFCTSTSVLPHNEGTPKGVNKQDVTYSEWSYSLPPGDGHHYNPQYSVFGFQDEIESLDSDETVCSIYGKELFRFRFMTIFPALDEKPVENSVRRILSDSEDAKDR